VPRIGYHCSHEQYAPSELLRLVRLAEAAGFRSAMASDHFAPWSERQGESGFAWSWLGAALQATSLPFGQLAIPGGWRFHPAVVAQAAATLAEMFPGRLWIAAGSGEALNEHVVGRRWPGKEERNARLREGVEIVRALWAGETVTRRGLLPTEEARLYSLPAEPPRILAAALSPETARWAGSWADGLVTTVGEREAMRAVLDAFREGGGEGKPLYLQAQLSFAERREAAEEAAWDQWRFALFPSPVLATLRTPAEFDAATTHLTREAVAGKIRCSADPEVHLEWLMGDAELGFEEILLHNVCRESQERFVEVFAERVIPVLSRAG